MFDFQKAIATLKLRNPDKERLIDSMLEGSDDEGSVSAQEQFMYIQHRVEGTQPTQRTPKRKKR